MGSGLALTPREDGWARLRCQVTAEGVVRNCQVLDESEPGQGFGAAAIAIAEKGRVEPRTVDGEARDATFQTTIRFVAGDPID